MISSAARSPVSTAPSKYTLSVDGSVFAAEMHRAFGFTFDAGEASVLTDLPVQDSHMHWARLELVDGDHLKGSWNSMKDGKVEWVAEAELVRQK
jgi:hypothetical protein